MEKIIHIGAGSCTELEEYIASGTREIVLVEPLPAMANSLKHKAVSLEGSASSIQVIEAAITVDATANQVFEFNLPDTASIREPQGLKALFPGLKTVAQHSVQTLSPSDLVEQFGPVQAESALLVIQAPGEAFAIVQSLVEAGQLKRFRQIQFTANPEPFYAGGSTADAVLAVLEQQGYEQVCTDDTDPDWPSWRLQRSPLQDHLDALTAQLEQSRQELHDKRTELAQVLDALDSSQKKNASLRGRLQDTESALQQKTHALVNEQALLQQQGEAYKAELEKIHLAYREQIAELRKQVAELEGVQTAAAQQQQAREAVEAELLLEQQNHEATLGALEKNKRWFAQRKQQAEKLLVENSELKQALEQQQKTHQVEQANNQRLQNEIQSLRQQLSQLEQEKLQSLQNQQQNTEAFLRLEERMTQMFEQQASQLQQSTNALGQHVTRSFRDQRQHLQTQISLANYLETGQQPLALGGWSIDADLATHLVNQLELNNYDLVIEFGSGASTLLMARVLANTSVMTSEGALEYDNPRDAGQKQYPSAIKSVLHDLPQRILSFEQEQRYQDHTLSILQKEGLDHLVDLVLAPLVPTAHTGQQVVQAPLFYACEQKLARIAQLFEGRQAKILVLVDGPVSPQQDPLVREPALASVLQYLSAHQLDFLLDDYQREGEQQVANYWQQLCERRGLSFEQQSLNTEKGACRVTVNP